MTVLSYQTIKAMCRGKEPLVIDHDSDQIKSASYDLRLGPEYYLEDDFGDMPRVLRVRSLNAAHMTLMIPANGVVLVRTAEDVNFPKNLVGHLSLKLDILLKGLIMASQSQIDAGYKGPIFALLYNLAAQPVAIQLHSSLLRLEFETLDHETKKPYSGDYKSHFTLSHIVKERLTSSLSSLHTEVQNVRQALNEELQRIRRRTYWAAAGVIATVITALIAFIGGFIVPFAHEASKASASVAESTIAYLTDQLRKEQLKINLLERQVKEIEKRVRRAPRSTSTAQP